MSLAVTVVESTSLLPLAPAESKLIWNVATVNLLFVLTEATLHITKGPSELLQIKVTSSEGHKLFSSTL